MFSAKTHVLSSIGQPRHRTKNSRVLFLPMLTRLHRNNFSTAKSRSSSSACSSISGAASSCVHCPCYQGFNKETWKTGWIFQSSGSWSL